jgi:hypothetical protein
MADVNEEAITTHEGPDPWPTWRVVRQQHPRSLVRTVYCPGCSAQPGQKCVGVRGKARVSNHMERVQLAERAYGRP